MPLNIRGPTQMFAGVLIGERMTYGDVLELRVIMVPAFVLIIGIIIVNLCIGIFITKVGGFQIITSLLASAQGGCSDSKSPWWRCTEGGNTAACAKMTVIVSPLIH